MKLTPAAIATLGRSAKDPLPFTYSQEQRRAVIAAMNGFVGDYVADDPESPLRWYYGQAFSLGLIQAARMLGQDRPILDLIKNREAYEEMVATGFDLVKNNATRAIVDKILPEIEALAIAGANPLSVAALLKNRFGSQNGNWRRLARTEMSMAAETAKLKEWAAWDVEMVEFTPAPDACPVCVALHGDYPIDRCPVPGRDTHPHCRCSIRPAESEVGGARRPAGDNQEFVPAGSIAEAANYAVANNLADMASYKGAAVEVANAWNRSVHDHLIKFPALRPNFKFIGTTQERQRRYIDLRLAELKQSYPTASEKYLLAQAKREAGKTPGNVYAYATSDRLTAGVSVNSKYAGKPETFLAHLKDDVANNFHPVGCDTVKSIIDHEIAHQLDALLKIRTSQEFRAIVSEFIASGKTIEGELSRYARYSPAETVAEAWAEYLNNAAPRPMAQRIGQLIEKLYTEQYGGSQ